MFSSSNEKCAKDLRVLLLPLSRLTPTPFRRDRFHSQNIARLWLGRAGGEKRAFFQVFRNPFPPA
jgi:hypothetical protein